MSNKILFCATMDYHFKAFHLPYLQWFKDQGWEVHVAANGHMDLPYVDQRFTIPIQRSPLSSDNLKAYKALKAIITDHEYRIIHCHTPLGGVLTRLAARKARKRGTNVIYTAHGFHFCKGVPLTNWILYYPIEKGLARWTDCLITINQEDYAIAVRNHFKAKRIERVHGVGVDTDRFRLLSEQERRKLRLKNGYQPEEFLLFYAAELNKNKNHQLLIRVVSLLIQEGVPVKLLLAGEGALQQELEELAQQLNVERHVDFLGFRNDIAVLLPMCDVAVSSSLREGLPVNIMEAMACGLPIVASRNRGHNELVQDEENGFIVPPEDEMLFAQRLMELYRSEELRYRMGLRSIWEVVPFSLERVGQEMRKIYVQYG